MSLATTISGTSHDAQAVAPSSARARWERNLCAWNLLLALALLAVMALPFWAGLVYTADDLGGFHLPLRAMYADELAQGRLLQWTPALFGGFFIAGEGQVGCYHPLHMALYGLLDLRPAYCLELLLSYPVMLAGSFFWLVRLLGRRDAALFGAMAFTFCGFNLLHFMHTNGIAVLAHLPWLLWAIDRMSTAACIRVRRLAWVVIALLTGSQLLLGYPQFVWFSLLAEWGFAAYLWRAARFDLRDAWWLCGALAAGALIGAVQLLATFDMLSHSVRQNIGREMVVLGSLHPWNLAQLVGPYLFKHRVVGINTHELGLYVGVIPLALFAWFVERPARVRQHRSLALAAAFVAGVALLLALGEWGGLYELQAYLPVVGKFRFPSRYVAIVSLGVAVVAAAAYGELAIRAYEPSKEHHTSWMMTLLPLVSMGVALAAPTLWGYENLANGWLRMAGPLLVTVACGLVLLAERGARWPLAAMALLLVIDLGAYGCSYAIFKDTVSLEEYLAAEKLPPGGPGDRVVLDYFDAKQPRPRAGNRLMLAGYERVDGYAGLEPARRLDLSSLAALRVGGVCWVAKCRQSDAIGGLVPVDANWYAVPHTMPRARFVTGALASEAPRRDLEHIALETTALVDKPVNLAGGQPGSVSDVYGTPGEIELMVDCRGTQLLALTESHHPGWRASIDGVSVEALRVNGDYLGCVVPAGRHAVRLAFRPASVMWGAATSALGMAITLSVGLMAWRRRG
ncbi:MAG: YfhO family protein [Pirellulales bacterium]|nr:YfhO family protein [Pirellulales bacterium]